MLPLLCLLLLDVKIDVIIQQADTIFSVAERYRTVPGTSTRTLDFGKKKNERKKLGDSSLSFSKR